MDTYGGGLGVVWVAIFETVAVMWIYGVNRFADDLKFMLNTNTNIFWKVTWSITPVILAVIFGLACWFWTAPVYTYGGGVVHYSHWAHGVGWFLTLLVALQIPVIAVIMVIAYAVRGKVGEVFKPAYGWGPGDPAVLDEYQAYQYRKAAKCKQHPHGIGGPYDNYGMQSPYGPGYGYPPQQPAYPGYHM